HRTGRRSPELPRRNAGKVWWSFPQNSRVLVLCQKHDLRSFQQRDHADWRPVARPAGPACRMTLAGLEARVMARGQDRSVLKGMALRGRDVADAAVPVPEVVPAREVAPPQARACSRSADRKSGVEGMRLEITSSR